MLSFSITFRAWQILEAPLPNPPKKSTPQPTEFQVILNMFESSCSSCDMSIFLDGFSEISFAAYLRFNTNCLHCSAGVSTANIREG